MIAPALAAERFLYACLLGLMLGFCYGGLRPLRQRHIHLADLLFLPVMFSAWVYLGFGICGGDLRPGYWLGLLAGGVAWELSIGRLLRPIFRGIWSVIFQILEIPPLALKKIFSKIAKFLLASGKKGGIMRKITSPVQGDRRRRSRHGKEKKHFSPDPPGLQTQQYCCEDRDAAGYRLVYGGTSDHGRRHS